MYCAPVTMLRLEFSFESGTLTLVSATEAGMKPENTPWKPKAIGICHGSVMKAAIRVVPVPK